jgi:hypothetical protein
MKLRSVLIAVGFGVAATALPMLAGPAQAIPNESNVGTLSTGSPPSSAPCVSTTGVKACFQASGDIWWVRDTKADDSTPAAEWAATDYSRYGECLNKSGYGTWVICNKNYKEGLKITLFGTTYGKVRNSTDKITVTA